MDKMEIMGYSGSAVCLVATLVVFFLWIMPNNAKIKSNLSAIDGTTKTLKQFATDASKITETQPGDYPKSLPMIEQLIDKMLVTPKVIDHIKNARKMVSAHSSELIKSVVTAHEVKPAEAAADKLRESQKLRAELKQLFEDKKVPMPPAKLLSLPEETEVTISDGQYATFLMCKAVLSKLLTASTTVAIKKGKADGPSNVVMEDVQIPEGIRSVVQFVYYDEKAWEARNILYDNETEKARKKFENAPDKSKPLPCKRVGIRLVFQTLPANVNAALASLENVDGYLMTIKRMEVIRANNVYFKKAEFDGKRTEVPQPYRDGNVQVLVEAELMGFKPKAGEELLARLFKAQ